MRQEHKFNRAGTVVMEMAAFHPEGNIVSISWFGIIKKKKKRTVPTGRMVDDGKGGLKKEVMVIEVEEPDYLAIHLLAEAVYWHRPQVKRSKRRHAEIYHQRFSGERWRVNYATLCHKFGATRLQIKESLDLLVSLGLIVKEFGTYDVRDTNGHIVSVMYNVMYLTVVPEQVKEITYRPGKEAEFSSEFDEDDEIVVEGDDEGGGSVNAEATPERTQYPPPTPPHCERKDPPPANASTFGDSEEIKGDFLGKKTRKNSSFSSQEEKPDTAEKSPPRAEPGKEEKEKQGYSTGDESPTKEILTHSSGRTYYLKESGAVIPTIVTWLWARRLAEAGEGDGIIQRIRILAAEAEELRLQCTQGGHNVSP